MHFELIKSNIYDLVHLVLELRATYHMLHWTCTCMFLLKRVSIDLHMYRRTRVSMKQQLGYFCRLQTCSTIGLFIFVLPLRYQDGPRLTLQQALICKLANSFVLPLKKQLNL